MTDINKEYTVTEIVKSIKDTLEGKYFYVKIKAEISNFKRHPSGHLYFSLKDENSLLNVVMFKSFADFCKIDLNDGMEIIATGKLTIYKERSSYQLLAEGIQISGIGTLLKLIQERKEKLSKEGLFDFERKKEIPKLPKSAVLITAESGAAIHDILSRLENRTPISLTLYSVLMQGKNAPYEIIEAIKYFNNLNVKIQPNVIVITRGGGSIEDLMAFNDEQLVREVANSKIPIISAIGHEIDWTLIDYASDLRLPTPTSVSEYLTITKEQAYENLKNLTLRLFSCLFFKNNRKFNYLLNIFNKFIKKKTNILIKNKYLLEIYFARFNSLFKLFLNFYRKKEFSIKNININKIIKLKLANLTKKINIINLRLINYSNKYPILIDKKGNKILFKKGLIIDENYILKFPDGNIKIKIIGTA